MKFTRELPENPEIGQFTFHSQFSIPNSIRLRFDTIGPIFREKQPPLRSRRKYGSGVTRSAIVRETTIWFAGMLWLGGVAGGFAAWSRAENAPGTVGSASTAEPAMNEWRLVAFAHPRCPCFRDTLAQLTAIHEVEPALKLRIVFVRPEDAEPGWERGESWDAAAKLPGFEVACDENGVETKRHGAETSGQVVLIQPDGRIVFRGGLTRSGGRLAVHDWIARGSGRTETPVFGCPLFTPTE